MPSLIMSIMGVIQGIIILRALKAYGTDLDITFYGAVFRIFNFSLTPIYGLMRALQPVAGINYGAKQYERSISSFKIFSFVALIIMLPFWLVSMCSPTLVLGSMLPNVSFNESYIASFRIFMTIAPLLSVTMTAMTFWPSIKKGSACNDNGTWQTAVFIYSAYDNTSKNFWNTVNIYRFSCN